MPGRSMKKLYGWQAFVLALLLGGSSVFAQGGAPVPAADSGDVLRNAGRLSGQEQLAQGQKYLGQMRQVQARVERLRETALKEKDVIRLNCVNEKLTEIKGNINIADRAARLLQEGVRANDAPERTLQFSKLLVLQQKVSVLGQEAEQCVGEDIRYTGATSVVTEVPSGLPDDPTNIEPPLPFIPRPQDASASF